jgi:hypothetical protein
MNLALSQILSLVGRIDDSPGEDAPRERFRRHLREQVKDAGQIRDYIEECLRTSGEQYNRALQDLVNHLGDLLGFSVTYGRYQGVHGQLGYDGHWVSRDGFHLVVEVKTTDVFAVKTSALVGYVDGLISEKIVPNWDCVLGLYVIGRPDPDVRQLENAIIAERRTHQLRVISVESLMALGEMMNAYDVSHSDILTILKPSEPTIDPLVSIMQNLVTGRVESEEEAEETQQPDVPAASMDHSNDGECVYWITPVKSVKGETAEECIRNLVGEVGIYAFSAGTPGRKRIKPGDRICFYATGKGVMADAKVTSYPENKRHPKVRSSEKHDWIFRVGDVRLYLDSPVAVNESLRRRLEAFNGKDATTNWAWFVQATRRTTEHDFEVLTGMVAS